MPDLRQYIERVDHHHHKTNRKSWYNDPYHRCLHSSLPHVAAGVGSWRLRPSLPRRSSVQSACRATTGSRRVLAPARSDVRASRPTGCWARGHFAAVPLHSTGQRNSFIEIVCWTSKVKRLARTLVQSKSDPTRGGTRFSRDWRSPRSPVHRASRRRMGCEIAWTRKANSTGVSGLGYAFFRIDKRFANHGRVSLSVRRFERQASVEACTFDRDKRIADVLLQSG